MSGVPREASGFTPGWLSDVLGVTVTGVTTEDIGAGSGIFGIITRLRLTHDGGAPDSLIAKLPTTAAANLEVGRALRMYEREARFYLEVADRVPVRLPRCHFAALDTDTGDACLLLEDLCDLAVGDQLVGLTQREAELATDALADVHARFWESDELAELGWLPTVDEPIYMATVPAIFHGGWPVVRASFAPVIEPAAAAVADAVDACFEEITRRCGGGPTTVIHTDSRLDNLFFSPADTGELAIIDWQLALRGRGVSDLAYLLATSMEPADQDRLFPVLVRRYHDRLLAGGVTGYPFERCLRDYREHALYYLCGAVSMAATFDTANERGAALTRAFVVRTFHHLLACDAAAALPGVPA